MAPRRSQKKRGGIGAIGSAFARFFHPSAPIRTRWPHEYRRQRLDGVLIVGKGDAYINRRNQTAYQCRINEFDDNTTFNIVCGNLKIEQEGPNGPFADEVEAPIAATPTPPAAAAVDPNAAARASTANVTNNLRTDAGVAEDIAELRRQGIEVDDDSEPAPENAIQLPSSADQVGEWVTPTTCPRRADPNIRNIEGQWKLYRWNRVADMNEFDLFCMCAPERYFSEIIIPATNVHLLQDMDLHEFYVWLGCRFFQACFEGISDVTEWWSSDEIDQFSGAPFRLNQYMSLDRFQQAITSAMRYTDREPPTSFVLRRQVS